MKMGRLMLARLEKFRKKFEKSNQIETIKHGQKFGENLESVLSKTNQLLLRLE